MTQLHSDLLRAICERPHDDNLRLIVADWWEEAGEADRAAFIRWQILGSGRIEYACMEDRSVGLICSEQSPCLCEGLHCEGMPWSMLGEDRYVMRRGFLDEIRCTLTDWAGEVCERCNGAGRTAVKIQGEYCLETLESQCQQCNGASRIGGHGPIIVACQPVTRLVLTDGLWVVPGEVFSQWLNWARGQVGLPALDSR